MSKSSLYGFLAEFSSPGELLKAAEKVREAGYRKFDCHSPFPVHGLDEAMGMRRTRLGLVIGLFGLLGAIGGFGLQTWTSTVGYPMVIAGKPYFSWQAFIIVTFGIMVLAGAFSALFGMLHFNGLPRFHHPLFNSDNFKKATDDGFFISIEAEDSLFDKQETKTLLLKIGAKNVEAISSE